MKSQSLKPSKASAVRLGAVTLSAALVAGLLAPAAGAATVKPVLDESYYGTLDYFGSLTEGSVVKSYRTNGNQTITDKGTYDEVVNLTDRTEPTVSGGTVTFDLGEEAPENFYFEGKTTKPYEEMPFRIQLSYRMNGVDTEPEDMAGQTGVGEILLDVTPNKSASEYAQNNYVFLATAILRDRDILSLEAEGAQIQKIGDMDAVLFLVLPGEEQHFTLRIGTEDFSFSGFTFLIEPATLAQLDMIADLKKAKEEVEDSYNSITASINTILNSLDGMDNKLISTANGLDQLNKGRDTLSSGKDRVYDEADEMLASMTELSQALAPVVEHLQTGKDALAETTTQLTALAETTDSLRPDLQALKTSLAAVRKDLDELNKTLQSAKNDTQKLSKLLGYLDSDLDQLQDDLADVIEETDDLSRALKNLKDMSTLDGMTADGMTSQEVKAYHDKSVAISSICQQMAAQDSSLTAPTDTTSYVMFVMAHKDDIATAAAQGDSAAEEQYKALLSEQKNVEKLAYLYYNWDQGDKVSDQLDEMDTFNGLIGQANDSIAEVNKTIQAIAKPTASLLDALSSLTSNANDDLLSDSRDALKTMQSLLDTANDYDTDALHQNLDAILGTADSLLGKTDTLLSQAKTLSDTVTKYEPDAQKALDDAITQVNASVKLLDNLNSFTKTFEDLMKAADPDIDQGLDTSLSGLSGSLKQMASGLGATDSMRKANNDIQDLIEDKWEEYTGEKNNMLNMDSQADMVSLTSEENQSPNSVQIILRSQEIQVDEDEIASQAAEKEQTTFFQRVGRMFKDFVAIFTGD